MIVRSAATAVLRQAEFDSWMRSFNLGSHALSTVARADLSTYRRGLATATEHVAIDPQSAVNSGMVTGDGPSVDTDVGATLAVKPGGKCLYVASGLASEP